MSEVDAPARTDATSGLEKRLKLVIDSVPSGLIMVDHEGRIVLCNSELEKMFGYTRAELIGKKIELLVPHRFRGIHPSQRSEFIDHPQKRPMGAGRDLRGLRKDGSEFPVEIGLNPVEMPEGRFVIASVLNITARKAIEEKLRSVFDEIQQKNQEMEQFVYTVSHDLKSPLVTTMSFIGFMREDIQDKRYDDLLDSLERVNKAQKRMSELINDLLQLSRVGRMELKFEVLNLTEVIELVIDSMEAKISEKKFKIMVPAPLPAVTADRKRIHQVFENLIGNALKYATASSEPTIEILAKDSPDETLVCVKDNGPGIEKQYHKKIFGLFQRLQTEQEGTGVGLSIVLRIMQMHGGRAWVESEPGKGAEFWLAFPKNPQQPKGAQDA